MSVPPDIADLVRQWLQKADNDLKTARHTLLIPDDCPCDTVCFHAQQCVEKCLKAILVCSQIPFGKTHDLEELSLLLPPSFRIPLAVEELAELTPHATNSRYPDDWRSPGRDQAEWAVTAAERIAQAVRSWLSPRLVE
jgi:HEPN domain-containing protein